MDLQPSAAGPREVCWAGSCRDVAAGLPALGRGREEAAREEALPRAGKGPWLEAPLTHSSINLRIYFGFMLALMRGELDPVCVFTAPVRARAHLSSAIPVLFRGLRIADIV